MFINAIVAVQIFVCSPFPLEKKGGTEQCGTDYFLPKPKGKVTHLSAMLYIIDINMVSYT